MAISQAFELDGVTVGVTELSIVSGTTALSTETSDGIFQLFVDAGNMAKADEFRVRIYEKVEDTGGTKKLLAMWSLMGVQSQIFVTPTFILLYGWDMTLQKIAGTDRAFDASIRKVA